MTISEIETDYLIDDRLKKYIYIYISANKYLSLLKKHRRTDATIKTYSSILRVLIRTIGQIHGEDARLDSLTEEDIYKLIDIMPGKEETVKARINVLGGWMEYETGNNLPKRMKILWNKSEPNRTFISKEQYQTILGYARNDSERLIISFGSQMGLRMNEIVNITLDDISGNYLTIYGKGHGKGKVVEKEIPDNLMDMIGQYFYGERKNVKAADYDGNRLLLQNTRNHPSGIPITDNNIIQMYNRISEESGMHVTSHVMRRLYCTLLADDAGLRNDLDTLRRMMRHESIDTTLSCYLDANTERMQKAQEKLNDVFKSL